VADWADTRAGENPTIASAVVAAAARMTRFLKRFTSHLSLEQNPKAMWQPCIDRFRTYQFGLNLFRINVCIDFNRTLPHFIRASQRLSLTSEENSRTARHSTTLSKPVTPILSRLRLREYNTLLIREAASGKNFRGARSLANPTRCPYLFPT